MRSGTRVGRGVTRIARGGEIEKSRAWGRQASIGGGGVERGESCVGRVRSPRAWDVGRGGEKPGRFDLDVLLALNFNGDEFLCVFF